MTKRMLMPFAFMLALTAAGPFAPGESKDQQQINTKNALTAQVMSMLVPQQCFSSGSGATFLKTCITNNGNISWIESPAGKVHLQSREGYAICSDIGYPNKTVHGFDANIASSGWGVSAVSQPGGVGTFPLIITRQSLDVSSVQADLHVQLRGARDRPCDGHQEHIGDCAAERGHVPLLRWGR